MAAACQLSKYVMCQNQVSGYELTASFVFLFSRKCIKWYIILGQKKILYHISHIWPIIQGHLLTCMCHIQDTSIKNVSRNTVYKIYKIPVRLFLYISEQIYPHIAKKTTYCNIYFTSYWYTCQKQIWLQNWINVPYKQNVWCAYIGDACAYICHIDINCDQEQCRDNTDDDNADDAKSEIYMASWMNLWCNHPIWRGVNHWYSIKILNVLLFNCITQTMSNFEKKKGQLDLCLFYQILH